MSPGYTWLTHNLNTTEVFVYLTGNGTASSPDTHFWAVHQGGYGGSVGWGAYWAGLNETSIVIYRVPGALSIAYSQQTILVQSVRKILASAKYRKRGDFAGQKFSDMATSPCLKGIRKHLKTVNDL